MDTQSFKAVSTRLEPLRRFLSDIALAAEQAQQAQQAMNEGRSQLAMLESQMEQLKAQIEHAEQMEADYKAKADEAEKASSARVLAAQAEASLKIDGLKKDFAEQQRLTQEQLTQAHILHRTRLAQMEREQKAAEENLRVVQESLKSIYERIGISPS